MVLVAMVSVHVTMDLQVHVVIVSVGITSAMPVKAVIHVRMIAPGKRGVTPDDDTAVVMVPGRALKRFHCAMVITSSFFFLLYL